MGQNNSPVWDCRFSNAGSDSCWRNERAGSGHIRSSFGADLQHMLEQTTVARRKSHRR